MKTIKKKTYIAPSTIIYQMQMEGLMVSPSQLKASTVYGNKLFNANKQDLQSLEVMVPFTAGDLKVDGGSDLEAAKGHNLFMDDEY